MLAFACSGEQGGAEGKGKACIVASADGGGGTCGSIAWEVRRPGSCYRSSVWKGKGGLHPQPIKGFEEDLIEPLVAETAAVHAEAAPMRMDFI